jgi:hypothetical protein
VARAAFAIADYETAWREAHATLALQPAHQDAMRVAVSAYFNRLTAGDGGPADESRWLETCTRLLALQNPDTRELRAVAALALWRAGRRMEAMIEWRSLGATASAVAARLLVGDSTVTHDDLSRAPVHLWQEPLVLLAATHLRIRPPPGITLPDPKSAQQVVARLFESRSP